MKILKRFVVWAMLSLMLQSIVLLYFEKVVFVETTKITYRNEEPEEKPEKVTEIKIPDEAENFELSYDGKFVAYMSNGKLKVINTSTGKSSYGILDEKNISVLCYDWQIDKNILLIAERKYNENGEEIINILAHNPSSNITREVHEVCDYKEGMLVENIANSTKSSVTYVPVSRGGNNTTIYRIDINDNIEKLDNKVASLGCINVFYAKDALIYEDRIKEQYYRYSNDQMSVIDFENPAKTTILGLTNNGVIFAGIKNAEDKVTEIIYGEDKISTKEWKKTTLPEPKEIRDLYIVKGDNSGSGDILVNNNLEGKVTNLTTNETVEYEGKFVAMNDSIVCSLKDSVLKIKSLKSTNK